MKSIYSISDWRRRTCVWYQTMWARVHSIARCLRGGQNRNCGLSTHSLEICLGSVRSIVATRRRVQFQMAGPLSHSIKRCINVPGLPHSLHVSESTRCFAARRSLVGIKSCITKYHADWTASDTQRIRSPDCPVRSGLLYRLRYYGPLRSDVDSENIACY
jgi:hypothetical protein